MTKKFKLLLTALCFLLLCTSCNSKKTNGTEADAITKEPLPTYTETLTPTEVPTQTPATTAEPDRGKISASVGGSELSLGMTVDELNKLLGTYSYHVPAEYKDCTWYVYNADYSSLVFALVKAGKAAGFFIDAEAFEYDKITSSTKAADLEAAGFRNTGVMEYLYERKEATIYANVYVDTLSDNTAEGIYFSYRDIEATIDFASCEPSYEKLIFEISNSFRKKNGISELDYDDIIAETARKHSKDMIDRDFFQHDNPDGLSPFDRMEHDGLIYYYAAENIAAGYDDPMCVTYGWINSAGHRSNLLNPALTRLGVGVEFGGSCKYYYTQNFYTPR